MNSVDVVKHLYDAFSRHDIEGILQTLAKDVDWTAPQFIPDGGKHPGREAVRKHLEAQARLYTELSVKVTEYLSLPGGRVLVAGNIHGRIATTGLAFDAATIWIWTVQGGVITRVEEFLDPTDLMLAMGYQLRAK